MDECVRASHSPRMRRTAAESRPCLKTGRLRGAVPAFLDNRLILTRMTAGGTGEWVENGGPEKPFRHPRAGLFAPILRRPRRCRPTLGRLRRPRSDILILPRNAVRREVGALRRSRPPLTELTEIFPAANPRSRPGRKKSGRAAAFFVMPPAAIRWRTGGRGGTITSRLFSTSGCPWSRLGGP
jgi:hypothetical protein